MRTIIGEHRKNFHKAERLYPTRKLGNLSGVNNFVVDIEASLDWNPSSLCGVYRVKYGDVMQRFHFLLSIAALMWFFTGCATSANAQLQETETPDSSANCPITLPGSTSFEAPAPFSPTAPFENEFWFGNENLWTALPRDGRWSGLPLNPDGYTQKIFWWSTLFSIEDEPQPDLVVFGKRLDGEAPALIASKATNASASDIGSAMLVGVDFPTAGCWEITGQYKKTELAFVIWVEP